MLQCSAEWTVAGGEKKSPKGEKEKRKNIKNVQTPENEQKVDQRYRELYLKSQTEVEKLKRQLEETNEKLEREKMQNYLRQNSESNISNGSESASASESSQKRQPVQKRNRSTGTEEQNREKLDLLDFQRLQKTQTSVKKMIVKNANT